MIINGIESIPFGITNFGRVGPSERWPTPAGSPPEGAYLATDYGADPTGIDDSTAAIVAALDAAGAAASLGNRKTVFLPAGTFDVWATGYMEVDVYTKAGGTWSLTQADASGQKVGDVHIYDVDPTSGDGADGELYINRYTDKVYRKGSGVWTQEDTLIEGAGTGWSADYHVPLDGEGSDGDIYIRYRGHTQAPFLVKSDWDHVTIQGAGSGSTKIRYRCWGGYAPDDYEISGSTIVRTAIPQSASISTRTSRTPVFEFKTFSAASTGFQFADLEIDGGATIDDYLHGYGTFFTELTQWDLNHKGIVLTYANNAVNSVKIENCHLHHFYGEIVYKGGANHCDVLLDDCEIAYAKSSATSMSAQVTMQNCYVHHVYNGIENLLHEATEQFLVVTNTTVDLYPSGHFGVVVISENETVGFSPYYHIDGLTVLGNSNYFERAGVFVECASNSGSYIRNSDFTDLPALFVKNTVNNGTYSITGLFDDIDIDGLTITATNRDIEYCFDFSVTTSLTGCTIDDVTVVESGAAVKAFTNTILDSADVTLNNISAPDVSVFSESFDANVFDGTGKLPVIGTGCTFGTNRCIDPTPTIKSRGPNTLVVVSNAGYTVTGIANNGLTGFNPDLHTDGQTLKLISSTPGAPSRTWTLAAASWNDLSSDLVVGDGDEVSFVWNATTEKMEQVV